MSDHPAESAAGAVPLIVAIDGPSGVGKSTVAKALAQRLEVPFLDTGAMYRTVALAVMESKIDPSDRAAVEELSARLDLTLAPAPGGGTSVLEVLLDGEPVAERIRTPEVSSVTSTIAVYPAVRRRLVELQRQTGHRFGAVVEGRDIGTRVFPDTPHKFFLDADPRVRAGRRQRQLAEQGKASKLDDVARKMVERDRRDMQREHSPLTHDDSYQLIDTTRLSTEQVIETLLRAVVEEG